MEFPELLLKIIEENSCPLYNGEEEFILSGAALMIPQDRPACIILVRDILRLMESPFSQPSGTFRCSGCTGRIKLSFRVDAFRASAASKKSTEELAVIAELLSRFEIFKSLERQDIKDIVSFLKLKKYAENEMVIRKGEPGQCLYIVASGRVEVLAENDVSIAFLGPGEVFGEMSLLSGDPVGASVRVVEPTRILFIRSADFRKILNWYPSLQMFFTRLLAKRLSTTNVARAEEFSSGMTGRLTEMSAIEVFQALNTNQKTGELALDLARGTAVAMVREGELVRAQYGPKVGIDAFYEILKAHDGRFKFKPGLTPEDERLPPLGDFMGLLMEGVRRLDETEGSGNP